jgi:hypothetical protein
MSSVWRLAVLMSACLASAPVRAQTGSTAHRAFLDVPLAADWDDAYSDNTRAPGAVWGTGVALGFDAGKSGVELDVGVPQWHVKQFAGSPYQYVGPSIRFLQQGHFYESSSTERRRSIDITAMHRANIEINQHATFTWLVGGGFVYRPEQTAGVTREVLPDGQLRDASTYARSSSRNYVAATARVDVEFEVVSHVSVVPRLRVTAFPSLFDDSGLAPAPFVARPEIAVRWRF